MTLGNGGVSSDAPQWTHIALCTAAELRLPYVPSDAIFVEQQDLDRCLTGQ
jgi:hypothetical protein